jgi:hypothetical protein
MTSYDSLLADYILHVRKLTFPWIASLCFSRMTYDSKGVVRACLDISYVIKVVYISEYIGENKLAERTASWIRYCEFRAWFAAVVTGRRYRVYCRFRGMISMDGDVLPRLPYWLSCHPDRFVGIHSLGADNHLSYRWYGCRLSPHRGGSTSVITELII